MQNLTIYANEQIRLHPNHYTADNARMAMEPFLALPLDIDDDELQEALDECLDTDTSEEPEELSPEGYFAAMGVRAQKELGEGVDIREAASGRYTVTHIDNRGRRGDAVEISEGELVRTVRELLGLPLNSE